MISPSVAEREGTGERNTDAVEGLAGTRSEGVSIPLLTAEELLAGVDIEHEVRIPAELLAARLEGSEAPTNGRSELAGGAVRLRALCLRDVQLIAKAARGDEVLTSVLMIQRAVVAPELDQRTISRLPSGLVRFLVDQINRISGLTTSEEEIRDMARAPIVQAFVVLAKEFGWTPEEIRGLTVGQVIGYLEMLSRSTGAHGR